MDDEILDSLKEFFDRTHQQRDCLHAILQDLTERTSRLDVAMSSALRADAGIERDIADPR